MNYLWEVLQNTKWRLAIIAAILTAIPVIAILDEITLLAVSVTMVAHLSFFTALAVGTADLKRAWAKRNEKG